MSAALPARSLRARVVILGVVALFLAPLVLAWWLINFTQFGQDGTPSSNGELIIPPRPLPDVVLLDPAPSNRTGHLHGKWSLVYLASGRCGQECEAGLYEMRQIRLALGKDADRVQRVLVVPGAGEFSLSGGQLRQYAGQLLLRDTELARETLPHAHLDAPAEGRLYVVDPLGNLMMSYPPGAAPGGVIQDLKRLLRYSRIG